MDKRDADNDKRLSKDLFYIEWVLGLLIAVTVTGVACIFMYAYGPEEIRHIITTIFAICLVIVTVCVIFVKSALKRADKMLKDLENEVKEESDEIP